MAEGWQAKNFLGYSYNLTPFWYSINKEILRAH